jgi:precorrin-6A/cobalt-precorrin-6A reductase
MHVLILGGTRDAMNLAELVLNHPHLRATYSLAGRTRRPLPSGLPTRRGGFGGIAGLVEWLQQEGVDAVVDATHPFAAQMSSHAVTACGEVGVPLVRLGRQPWAPEEGDRWLRVADLPAAAEQLRLTATPGQRVLLTTGGTSLSHFTELDQLHFVVRCVDPPEPAPAFVSWTLITDRGPFDLAREQQLLAEHRIDILVSKNSGGTAAQPKLAAARAAGLPVIMVDRPTGPTAAKELYDPAAVVSWLESLLSVDHSG